MSEEIQLEVLRKVFTGTVPIRVYVDILDIPLCFNAPRCAMFGSFIFDKIKREIGEECENFHIKINNELCIQPNIPIGVVFDSFFAPKSGFHALNVNVITKLHNEDALQCSNEDIAFHYFSHSFKESLFIKNGNISILHTYIDNVRRISDAILSQDFNLYKEKIEPFSNQISNWEKWPVKIYQKGEKVIPAFLTVEGEDQTLADVLMFKEISKEKVIIQGIEVSTDTKMTEIIPVLLYPNGFLYVVV